MLVQMYYPQSLSANRLDKYLAGGWFRSSYMLFRSQVMYLRGDVYALVNIRLKLDDYQPNRSLRRTQKRCQDRFKVVFQKATFDPEKEALYQSQKAHFQGFVFESLELFMNANIEQTIFDTWEVGVYEGDKLIAVSFFDVGQNSLASILALYDRQNYAKYSLGTYTMMLEIEYAVRQGFKFYYSGHILECPSSFDYKLRVGNCQYYNWKGRWKSMDKLSEETFPVHVMKQKIAVLESELHQHHIYSKKLVYPFFSMGYLLFFPERFLKNSLYLFCFYEPDQKQQVVVEYDLDLEIYVLSQVEECEEYNDLLHIDLLTDLSDTDKYYPNLLMYKRTIFSSESPTEIVKKLIDSQLAQKKYECRQIPVQTKYLTQIRTDIS